MVALGRPRKCVWVAESMVIILIAVMSKAIAMTSSLLSQNITNPLKKFECMLFCGNPMFICSFICKDQHKGKVQCFIQREVSYFTPLFYDYIYPFLRSHIEKSKLTFILDLLTGYRHIKIPYNIAFDVKCCFNSNFNIKNSAHFSDDKVETEMCVMELMTGQKIKDTIPIFPDSSKLMMYKIYRVYVLQ